MRVVAQILNWKRPSETLRCLASLAAQAPEAIPLVVDNASDDGSVERIRAEFPHVAVLVNGRNAGYAGGNDAGFRLLLEGSAGNGRLIGSAPERPDAVLVLNNDVEVLPHCVSALIAAAQADPARGLFAPVSHDAADPEVLDFHRAVVDVPNMAVHAFGRGERRVVERDAESDYAPGSAFLVRTPVLERLGGFDEQFFLVWEDVDLSLRAAKSGFGRTKIVAGARVLHAGSVSFGGAATPTYRYYFVRNSYLLARKHLRGVRRWRTLRLLDRRYEGWAAKTADTGIRDAILAAIADAHSGRFGPRPAGV